MISEGSCDTEDWRNDAENHKNKSHFKLNENRIILSVNFNNLFCFYCIID